MMYEQPPKDCRCSVDDMNLGTMNYLVTEEVSMKHEGQEEERERAIVIVVTCHHIGTRTSWDVGGYAPSHLLSWGLWAS